MIRSILLCLCIYAYAATAAAAAAAAAFTPPYSPTKIHRSTTTGGKSWNNGNGSSSARGSNNIVVMNERRWNFNEGRGPWGLKKNAEIWNGRVAQVAFTVVLLQELITGKGVVAGLKDGDFFNQALFGLALVSTGLLTIFLAIQGKEDDIVFDRSKIDQLD